MAAAMTLLADLPPLIWAAISARRVIFQDIHQ
jgi:hypothetical protein